jgi:large subunit ribosomal protein L22
MEAVAKLRNNPTSTRKMRLIADMIRGKQVEQALGLLQFSKKHPSTPLYKLVMSAVDNWKQKNTGSRPEDSNLYIKTIFVDMGVTIKRYTNAPQGRMYRIRKRSNHVTVIVDSKPLEAGATATTAKTAAEVVPAVEVAAPKVKKAAKPRATKAAKATK